MKKLILVLLALLPLAASAQYDKDIEVLNFSEAEAIIDEHDTLKVGAYRMENENALKHC